MNHFRDVTKMMGPQRTVLDDKMTEKEFQAEVIRFAKLRNWRVYHTHDSRRSAAGFPDLVLVRHAQLIFAELKTAKGRVSPEQRDWIEALGLAARVYVWRPANWDFIVDVLM